MKNKFFYVLKTISIVCILYFLMALVLVLIIPQNEYHRRIFDLFRYNNKTDSLIRYYFKIVPIRDDQNKKEQFFSLDIPQKIDLKKIHIFYSKMLLSHLDNDSTNVGTSINKSPLLLAFLSPYYFLTQGIDTLSNKFFQYSTIGNKYYTDSVICYKTFLVNYGVSEELISFDIYLYLKEKRPLTIWTRFHDVKNEPPYTFLEYYLSSIIFYDKIPNEVLQDSVILVRNNNPT